MAFACAPFMPCACADGSLHGLCLCTLHALCMCWWCILWHLPVHPSCHVHVLMVAFMAFACAPFMPRACAGGLPNCGNRSHPHLLGLCIVYVFLSVVNNYWYRSNRKATYMYLVFAKRYTDNIISNSFYFFIFTKTCDTFFIRRC